MEGFLTSCRIFEGLEELFLMKATPESVMEECRVDIFVSSDKFLNDADELLEYLAEVGE